MTFRDLDTKLQRLVFRAVQRRQQFQSKIKTLGYTLDTSLTEEVMERLPESCYPFIMEALSISDSPDGIPEYVPETDRRDNNEF
jgi:hypothetical protein